MDGAGAGGAAPERRKQLTAAEAVNHKRQLAQMVERELALTGLVAGNSAQKTAAASSDYNGFHTARGGVWKIELLTRVQEETRVQRGDALVAAATYTGGGCGVGRRRGYLPGTHLLRVGVSPRQGEDVAKVPLTISCERPSRNEPQ